MKLAALILAVCTFTAAAAEPSLVYLQAFSTANALLSAASPAPDSNSVAADEHMAAGDHSGLWTNLFKGLQFPFGHRAQQQHLLVDAEHGYDHGGGARPGSFSVDVGQYEDESLFRFNFASAKEQDKLRFASETLMLDIWEMDTNYATVRIGRRRLPDFLRLLPKSMRKHYEEVVDDIQRSVFSSYPLRHGALTSKDLGLNGLFEDYRDLSDIVEWLDNFEARYSAFAAGECIGITHEKRELRMVRLGPSPAAAKSSIVVTGGFQGRDWLSVSNALFVMNSIAREFEQTKRGVLVDTAVYFVPLMNPDGYAYTWEHDRLWRKNRQPTGVLACSGIDIEHSFGTATNIASTEVPVHPRSKSNTLSVSPCSENYGGYEPFEALEAVHLQKLVSSIAPSGYFQLSSSSAPLTAVTVGSCDLGKMVSNHRQPVRLVSYDRVQQTHTNSTLLERMGEAALMLHAGGSGALGVLAPRRVLGETGELAVSVFREWASTV